MKPEQSHSHPENLDVDPDADYAMYEFWTQKSHGTMKGSFAIDVYAHSVRLLAIHKVKAIPQWISSDRHVTQNASELKEYEWKTGSRSLEGKIQLISTFPLTMRLRVPPGYNFTKAECPGVKCSAKQETNDILAIKFITDKTGDFEFRIKY